MTTMLSSDLPLNQSGRGKVRDIYAVDDERLLLVTTDRISAFDVVMAETIPMKGAVLTQISAWWFDQLGGVVPPHMISADAAEIIDAVPALKDHRAALAGRAMLCRRTTVFTIECVIRGYITGSAWKEYAASGTLAGEKLAEGLKESERLEPPIFSPATKAETGHDENITIARMREIIGDEAGGVADFGEQAQTVEAQGSVVGVGQCLLELADGRLLIGADHVQRSEVVLDVDTGAGPRFALVLGRYFGRTGGQVAHMSAAGLDHVTVAEEAGEHGRLGRRLDDHQSAGGCGHVTVLLCGSASGRTWGMVAPITATGAGGRSLSPSPTACQSDVWSPRR